MSTKADKAVSYLVVGSALVFVWVVAGPIWFGIGCFMLYLSKGNN